MRKLIVSLACLAAVSMLGCTAEYGEVGDESLGQVTEEFVLDSSTPTWYHKKEGYTSGGGQRVRGEARLNRVSQGNGSTRFSVDLVATNWKKNFGWNHKRTTQLRIVGSVFLETTNTSEYVTVDMGTGGALKDTIGGTVVSLTDTGSFTRATLDLDFYGRDGTHCEM